MPTPSSESRRKAQQGTYFVQDQRNKQELLRVLLQDQMITARMGGVLPEQDDPAQFKHILDVGCGTGAWIIEAAQIYSTMTLIGIDINPRMIKYGREQAKNSNVSDRITFQPMDALSKLTFPANSFDLTNLRLGVSYVRTWDWRNLLSEMIRVTRTGGTVRLTDNNILHESNSPATTRLYEIAIRTLFLAGHLFTQSGDGLTAHLARLLKQHGCDRIQSKSYALEFHAGTPEGEAYIENITRVFQTTYPFINKWGCAPADYQKIYQQAVEDMSREDFHSTWHYLTAWGIKAEQQGR